MEKRCLEKKAKKADILVKRAIEKEIKKAVIIAKAEKMKEDKTVKEKKVKKDKVVIADKALKDKVVKNLSITIKKVQAQKCKIALLLNNGITTKIKWKEKDEVEEE